MARDRFHIRIRVTNVPQTAVWDLLRSTRDNALALFKPQVHGMWVLDMKGSTANSRHYSRKSLHALRDAFEFALASPRSVDVSLRKSLGIAGVDYVSISGRFSGAQSNVEVWIFGFQREDVERFAAAIGRSFQTAPAILDVAPELVVDARPLSVSTTDRGRGRVVGGWNLATWFLTLATAVIAGVLIAVVLAWLGLKA